MFGFHKVCSFLSLVVFCPAGGLIDVFCSGQVMSVGSGGWVVLVMAAAAAAAAAAAVIVVVVTWQLPTMFMPVRLSFRKHAAVNFQQSALLRSRPGVRAARIPTFPVCPSCDSCLQLRLVWTGW